MKKRALKIVICFLLLTYPVGAFELETYRGPEITVRYQRPLIEPAKRVGSYYHRARTEIEKKLGWRLRSDPHVVLLGDTDAFQEMARNTLVTALAIPERKLIVIDYSHMDKIPHDLEDTLKHELSHILLHERIDSSVLPKWLDEGVSQWASGGVADILQSEEKDILRQAVLSGRLIPLTEIRLNFPEDHRGIKLAYEQSRSFVEFFVKQYGEEKLRFILQGLENQKTIDQAVYDVLGVRFDTLEQLWKKGLSRETLSQIVH